QVRARSPSPRHVFPQWNPACHTPAFLSALAPPRDGLPIGRPVGPLWVCPVPLPPPPPTPKDSGPAAQDRRKNVAPHAPADCPELGTRLAGKVGPPSPETNGPPRRTYPPARPASLS